MRRIFENKQDFAFFFLVGNTCVYYFLKLFHFEKQKKIKLYNHLFIYYGIIVIYYNNISKSITVKYKTKKNRVHSKMQG
jgi:hypothetical protein